MAIKFNLNGTDVKVVDSFQYKSQLLMDALVEKMTVLMTELQQRAVSKVIGRVADSIRNPRADVEGDLVVGRLDWGGIEVTGKGTGKTYDLARILEEGSKPHSIYPLGKAIIGHPRGKLGGTRPHVKGATRQFGGDVLHFYSQRLGKWAFATMLTGRSEHPGTAGQHFMANSINEMRSKFKTEVEATLKNVLSKRK